MRGKRVSILGMARSGTAAAALISRYGGTPFVSEMKPRDAVTREADFLDTLRIRYETGGHTQVLNKEADYVVVSPGIAPSAPVIQQLEQRGLPVFSEVEVAFWLCPARVIAVTGTNGKSTTTAWTAHIVNTSGRRAVATGNIGQPFSSSVDMLTEGDYAVVEISSFQLERIERFKPKAAAILNITPDHLDRHKTLEDYIVAKSRIAIAQDETDYLVLNSDDPTLKSLSVSSNPHIIHFATTAAVKEGVCVKDDALVYSLSERSGKICSTSRLSLPGPHNLANAAAAAALAVSVGIEPEAIAEGLATFPGIPHRFEKVAEINGVLYINDSKATNVDSVRYALQSLTGSAVLIMGGRDKGGDFTALKELVEAKVFKIFVIGEAAEKITAALSTSTLVSSADSLEKAVELASVLAEEGDTVLLSPGCASFDQFQDFEDRGNRFKQAVMRLREGG